MKLKISIVAALATIVAALVPALATSNYTYGKNEYVTVKGGMAPDKRYSIAGHGEGDLALDKFNLFLMKEPGHKVIGPLTEIEEYLDTAADAYTAKWSPDSRHVAIIFRSDRRILSLFIYRIENGRAFIVTGQTPLVAAGIAIGPPKETEDDSEHQELRLRGFDLEWANARSFRLVEDGRAWLKPDIAAAHARYGAVNIDPAETGAPEPLQELSYTIVADCELAGADTYRVRSVRPHD